MRCCISVAHTIKPISPHFKASPDTCFGGGGISLCEMTEGADVSDNANLSYIIVGADLCVRPLDRNTAFNSKRFLCAELYVHLSR